MIEDEQIVAVLMWFALLFPVNALGSVPEALLQKRLLFFRRGIVDILAAVLKLLVTVALLKAGFGVWSMVWGVLAAAASRTVLMILLAGWLPKALPSWGKVGHLVRYGKHIVFINILTPLSGRLDQFAIAFLMGDASLGLYFVASRIPDVLITGLNGIITRVVFPAFVTIAGDVAFLGRAYLATTKWCLVLLAPIAIGLAATAGQTVPLVFGDEWTAAVPVLACLALNGIPVTIGWSSGDVFKSTGRPYLLSYLTIIDIVVGAPLIWLTAVVTGDIVLVAIAMLAAATLSTTLRLFFMRHYAGVAILRTLKAISPPLLAAAAMGAVILLFDMFSGVAPGLGKLVLSAGLGLAAYAVTLLLLDRNGLVAGYRQIRQRPASP